jgi:transcriptional regulator GlxA family with amidase domain
VFGPVEILGRIKDDYDVKFYSASGGIVQNHHGIRIATDKLSTIAQAEYILLIPGGPGTRGAIEDQSLVDAVARASEAATYVLTVCTGSALLARTGLLNARRATSNKKAFAWASSYGDNVTWIPKARWTVDGKFYTSSGVSAGMDMTLGFLADRHGVGFARHVAFEMEYHWHEDKESDPFTRDY